MKKSIKAVLKTALSGGLLCKSHNEENNKFLFSFFNFYKVLVFVFSS